MTEPNLTQRQAKWFASARASLVRDTGKSLEVWVAIARTCPQSGHRARLKWLKDEHGLLQNRASMVLHEAFPPLSGWSDAGALIDTLWADPSSRAIYEAIDGRANALPDVVRTARKGYTAWSRRFQFAAARPVKGGKAMLGLAVGRGIDPRLQAPRNVSWSERLKAQIALSSPADVGDVLGALLRSAWEGA